MTAEKYVQVARKKGRGGRGNLGNARKKSIFLMGGVPLGVFNLDADSLKEEKGRLHELPSTFCILVFPQITRLRRCIPALVAFAGHGPGVSLGAAGERRLTRHLSTTLGHGADSGNPTLPSFLSSPTRTLCSALFSSV